MKYILILALFFISSCATLKDDPAPASIASNYPSAEIIQGSDRFNGIKVVGIEKGKDLASLGLKIQTYFNGSVTIDSKLCNIATSVDYQNSEIVSIPISGVADHSCGITFTVSPSYPAQSNSAIKVYGFRGFIWIEVIDPGINLFTFEKKGTENFSVPLSLPASGDMATLYVKGCGANFQQQYIVSNGLVPVDFGTMLNITDMNEPCVLEAALISQSVLKITGVIAKYDSKFSPLPIPYVTIKNDHLDLQASSVVSVVGVDGVFSFDNSASVDFEQTHPHFIEILTVKGRSVIGVYNQGKMVWAQ